MAIATENLIADLQSTFGTALSNFEEPYGLLTFQTNKDSIIPVLKYLNENESYRFRFLTDVCAVHYPTTKELAVVYHVQSMENNFRLRIKVFIPESNPKIPTATVLYESANWQERETYDFYGINFIGHPDLRRVLNVDEMDYFPLRKEYPLEDQTRIDKDDEMFGR